MKTRFNIRFTDEAWNFILGLDEKVKAKVTYNMQRSREVIDSSLFKKLNNDIWEFRTAFAKNEIRLLAFWSPEEDALVICTHGFFKKSQKTPIREIIKAQRIRSAYLKKS